MELINFHVVVSKDTIEYFEYQIANIRHTAKNPEQLRFLCYALDKETWQAFSDRDGVYFCMPVFQNSWAYRKKTWAERKLFLRWLLIRKPMLGGSNGHAAGLQGAAIKMKALAGHHIIADVDTVMLTNDWDVIVREGLKHFELVGAPYEPIGGFSSGNAIVQTYKDFPTAVWVALRSGLPWHLVNWWPKKETNLKIETSEMEVIYNLPLGYELVRDVGWSLCSFAHDRGFKSASFEHIKASNPLVQILKTGADYNEEYQFNGVALVGHQRGSSRNPFKKTDLSKKFFDCVESAVGEPCAVNDDLKK